MYTYMCIYIYMYRHVYVSLSLSLPRLTYACKYGSRGHVLVHTFVCIISICMYVYLCIYICTSTWYRHTCIRYLSIHTYVPICVSVQVRPGPCNGLSRVLLRTAITQIFIRSHRVSSVKFWGRPLVDRPGLIQLMQSWWWFQASFAVRLPRCIFRLADSTRETKQHLGISSAQTADIDRKPSLCIYL